MAAAGMRPWLSGATRNALEDGRGAPAAHEYVMSAQSAEEPLRLQHRVDEVISRRRGPAQGRGRAVSGCKARLSSGDINQSTRGLAAQASQSPKFL